MELFILSLIFLLVGYGLLRLSKFVGKLQEAGRLSQEQEEYEYQKSLEVEARLAQESELDKLLRANKARNQRKEMDSMLEDVMNTPIK